MNRLLEIDGATFMEIEVDGVMCKRATQLESVSSQMLGGLKHYLMEVPRFDLITATGRAGLSSRPGNWCMRR
jgi:hypothetical protein